MVATMFGSLIVHARPHDVAQLAREAPAEGGEPVGAWRVLPAAPGRPATGAS